MSFKAKLWVKMFPHHPKKQHQPAGRSLPSCGNRNVWWVDLHVLDYKTCPIEIEWIYPTYHTWKIQCPTSHNDHHHYLGWPCSITIVTGTILAKLALSYSRLLNPWLYCQYVLGQWGIRYCTVEAAEGAFSSYISVGKRHIRRSY